MSLPECGAFGFHPAGKAGRERLHRELQWQAARRVFECGGLFQSGRCSPQAIIVLWRQDCNHQRPYSSLADRTPAEFAAAVSFGNDADCVRLENASRFPHSHRTTTTGNQVRMGQRSSPLLETPHLNYISSNQAGTNRTTQAEISNLLRHSFPGRVTVLVLNLSLVQFCGFGSKQVEAGRKVEDVALEVGVSKHTIYGWKAKYGGLQVSEAQRLRQLEDENGRLKKLVADLSLDREMLKAVIAKKA